MARVIGAVYKVECCGETHRIHEIYGGAITPLDCTWEQIRAEQLAARLGGTRLLGCAEYTFNQVFERKLNSNRTRAKPPAPQSVRERAARAVARVLAKFYLLSHRHDLLRGLTLVELRRATARYPEPIRALRKDGNSTRVQPVKLLEHGCVEAIIRGVSHPRYTLTRVRWDAEGRRWWLE